MSPITQPVYDVRTDALVDHVGAYTDQEVAAHAADAAIHSSGRELGYAEITSDYGGTALATTQADVTGLITTVEVGVRPIIVKFVGFFQKQTNAGTMFAYIKEGAAGVDGTLLYTAGQTLGVLEYTSAVGEARLTPSAGLHTYKIRLGMSTSGGRINATASGGAVGPSFIQVIEV